MNRPLSPQAARELAAAACMAERSVWRAYRGEQPVRPSTLERLRRAAKSLGHPLPPVPGQRDHVAERAS